MFDYLIVGAGLFGSVFAHEMSKRGRKCLVIDKRTHIGGNCFTQCVDDIQVHAYGAHIFHTHDKAVWQYINQFAQFNRYTNSPVANYQGKLYNLPFNMNTFYQLWGVTTPQLAKDEIARQRVAVTVNPRNLEEQAISLVGTDIYHKLIRGYTKKQWGRDPKDLPAFIIKRLPLRFIFDNNYFDDPFQGIPIGGYSSIFEKLLTTSTVKLGVDYFSQRESLNSLAKTVVYTGMIDQFFDYRFGTLEYRSLRFETESLDVENFQGNAVINYTEEAVPYTRIIEHKHFEFGQQVKTVISKEFSVEWKKGDEPYYPVNDQRNMELFACYRRLADQTPKVLFGGRLANYCYYDMHQVIRMSLEMVKAEEKKKE